MYELNIFEWAASGSLVVVALLLVGLVLSGVLGGMWRWIDRDDSTKPSWITKQLTKFWECPEDDAGTAVSVTIAIIMAVPQVVAGMFLMWELTLIVSLFIAIMYLSRYAVDHNKVFKKHVADDSRHIDGRLGDE